MLIGNVFLYNNKSRSLSRDTVFKNINGAIDRLKNKCIKYQIFEDRKGEQIIIFRSPRKSLCAYWVA